MFFNYCQSFIILLHIAVGKGQYCIKWQQTVKTRVQHVPGQRLIAKSGLFGSRLIKENYITTQIQNYHDYERVYVCCEGYSKIDETNCVPVCDPSCPSNTHCIRPNVCECNFDYRGYTASAIGIQCQAFCEPSCDANAECIEPHKCICKMGYQDTNGSGRCQAVCKNGCPENSNCTKPDQCTCYPGYKDNGWGECLPECNPKCPEFSDCTQSNTCICHENYKAEDGICKPICKETCLQHAVCVRPNMCACLKGYEPIESNSTSKLGCKAICHEDCPAFAFCDEPNICVCEQGYNKTEKNLCEPVCKDGCPEHSNCTAPNTCICDSGFVMLEQQCQPVCEKPCPEFAFCGEPNKCICQNGYQLKLTSMYNLYCEPVCHSNCSTFGKCVQPNKCECLAGYAMDDNELCQPVCSHGCKNGLCFEPEICVCNPGYLMGPQNECEPVCSMVCHFGSCIEPEICQCHEGYNFANNSINMCEPICETDCINGVCAAPNICICHENYEPQRSKAGLNHSNCQVILTTTSTEQSLTISTSATSDLNNFDLRFAATSLATTRHHFTTSSLTTKSIPDLLKPTSVKTLVAASNCNDMCQCWQEYDEYGALTFQKCLHLCVDVYDKSCLDTSLCQCDLNKNQLVCHSNEEDLYSDDPIYYECNSALEQGVKSDMKISKPTEASEFIWWWAIILGVLVALCLLGAVVFFYLRTPDDPIMEYEL